MTNLHLLQTRYQQSPWLDNISRDLIQSGRLQQYLNDGILGVTSNPTILERAITTSSLYDEQIKSLAASGASTEDIYWKVVFDDIRSAAEKLKPIWDETGGKDGYISLEVSPTLADDTDGTIAQAKWIWQELNIQNLMIKVPATPAGIPAVRELLASGINVNITLIFSLDRYKQVVDAYKETHPDGSNTAHSVASFFVSRFDTEVDKRLDTIGTDEALGLRGKAAIAQSHLAYEIYLNAFTDNNAVNQRLLWASTSTKNPDYNDLLYVNNLLTPVSVNTLPEETIGCILDHFSDTAAEVTMADISKAHETVNALAAVGIDINDVTNVLESEGVEKFQASFASLMSALENKNNNL